MTLHVELPGAGYPTTSRSVVQRRQITLAILVLLLIFTAFLRIRHLVDFVEWPDEIYTVWQAKMNIRDGLIHTDPFWPPLFGTLVWVWMNLVGLSLEAIRFLSVLFSLLGTYCVYQAARALYRLAGQYPARATQAGIIAALAFATMGSMSLIRQLLVANLVDRLKLAVCPLILPKTGAEPTFEGLPDLGFDLVSNKVLDGRVLLLEYRPMGEPSYRD
jgi:hypothetical protein